MAAERPDIIPESVASKPKTFLKQAIEVLRARSDCQQAEVFIEKIFNEIGDPLIVVSPIEPKFDIDALNRFATSIFKQLGPELLVPDVKGASIMPTFTPAEKWDRKGGIRFPNIRYGSEVIGKKVTTIDINVSDDIYTDPVEPTEREIERNSTAVRIFPSIQIAELALAFMNGQGYRIPTELKASSDIRRGITERQLKLLGGRVTIKPSNSI